MSNHQLGETRAWGCFSAAYLAENEWHISFTDSNGEECIGFYSYGYFRIRTAVGLKQPPLTPGDLLKLSQFLDSLE